MTTKTTRKKPLKPHPEFPLTANGNGQWSKKIRGKVYYFGAWENRDAALQNYLDVKDDLLAGRTPQPRDKEGLLLIDLVNQFLHAKKQFVDSQELTQRSWNEYRDTCARFIGILGRNRGVEQLTVQEFLHLRSELAEGRGLITLGNDIRRLRSLFKFAFDADLVERPVKLGSAFKQPGKKARRRLRNSQGLRQFTASEIHQLLGEAAPQLRAMILLGINCGFGNSDCATLPIDKIDFNRGWHQYGRPKTGVPRRCPLWEQTATALVTVRNARRAPKDAAHKDLLLLTKFGLPWVRQPTSATTSMKDSIAQEFRKLTHKLGIQRHGASFYSLRRTFRTVADASGDQPAVNFIMGHADSDNDMASVYRQEISDERLIAVTAYVHSWLFS